MKEQNDLSLENFQSFGNFTNRSPRFIEKEEDKWKDVLKIDEIETREDDENLNDSLELRPIPKVLNKEVYSNSNKYTSLGTELNNQSTKDAKLNDNSDLVDQINTHEINVDIKEITFGNNDKNINDFDAHE